MVKIMENPIFGNIHPVILGLFHTTSRIGIPMNQSVQRNVSQGLGKRCEVSPAKMRNIVLMGGFLHIAESEKGKILGIAHEM